MSTLKAGFNRLAGALLLCASALVNGDSPAEKTPVAALDIEISASLAELVEPDNRRYFARELADDAPITWTLHVPADYNPDNPPGLLVYVPPLPTGAIPPSWKPVMAEKNLIWVAANRSGNTIDPGLRFSYAMLAPLMIDDHYTVNTERIYISGFSGGGRVASAIAPLYPALFKGAIYNCGVNSWGPDKPAQIDLVRENRYVFVTGTKDFNRSQTREIYREYKRAAVKGIKFMDIEGMPHSNPRANYLAEAIDFLDER